MKHKPISKRIRELVYAKYNGHCAYCGSEITLKDMQVDHIKSVLTRLVRMAGWMHKTIPSIILILHVGNAISTNKRQI